LIAPLPEAAGRGVEEEHGKRLETIEYKRARFFVAGLRLDLPMSGRMKPAGLTERMRASIRRCMPLVPDPPVEPPDARFGRRQFHRRAESVPWIELNVRPRKNVATDCISNLGFEGCKRLDQTWRQTKVRCVWDMTVPPRL
jgi:hypothetical protein